MSSNRSDKQPRQVGQYYLMEKIAQGGMAEIFKGLSYDVHGLKKTVCIKKILPHIAASNEFIDSLIDEAKIAVKLVHGNIAQTYDLGKVGEDYFMVMEYVDGKSLSQIHKRCLSRDDLIPMQYLVYFISEILNGLDYIHRRIDEDGIPMRIVHRDMSPQNIMVSYSGTVKIIDFGIAKTGFKVGGTDSGVLKGKFAYMSPEQAYGDTIDRRSDIFSVGIMLHEMLVGKRLFKADDSRETIRNVRRAEVEPISSFRSDIPDELDRISLKALSKSVRRRYQYASEMRDDLTKFLHSSFPNFKPSDITTFAQELFKDEFGQPEKVERDSKTPYLIIDRSNSALADDSQFEVTGRAKAPIDLKEYMIDEESASISKEETAEATGSAEEELPEIEEERIPEEPTTPKAKIPPRTFRYTKYISILVAGLSLTAAAVYHYYIRQDIDPAKAIAPTFAEVMVKTDPVDAEVVIDGKIEGRGSPVTIRNITTDEIHTLVVRKDGFLSNERNLDLEPGEFLSISVKLTRATPSIASIEFTTNPPGATVFIDDKETLKRTPATLPDLDPRKEHNIGLYLKGYRFWSKKVNLKAGETKSYDIQLTKDFGMLTINSEPSDALVMLNGAPVGQTPITRDNLEPNKVYKIEVWTKGYKTAEKEIKLGAGQKQDLRFVLEKAPTPAEIEAAARGKKTETKKSK